KQRAQRAMAVASASAGARDPARSPAPSDMPAASELEVCGLGRRLLREPAGWGRFPDDAARDCCPASSSGRCRVSAGVDSAMRGAETAARRVPVVAVEIAVRIAARRLTWVAGVGGGVLASVAVAAPAPPAAGPGAPGGSGG